MTFKIQSEQGCLAGAVLAVVRVPISFLNHCAVTVKHCVVSGNDKQRGARKMSGSGTCVEPNKPPSIDTATCIPQANELLRLASVLTPRGSDYAVKESQDTCSNTHTHSCHHPPSAVTVTTEKPGSRMASTVISVPVKHIV